MSGTHIYILVLSSPPYQYGVSYRYGDDRTRMIILHVVIVHVFCISDDTFTVHILSSILFSNNGASILLSCSLRYIYYFIRKKKKKKIKPPSFDASSLLYDHSLPNEHTPHTPRHGPYWPTWSKPLDKNRSRRASLCRSRLRFVFTIIKMRWT